MATIWTNIHTRPKKAGRVEKPIGPSDHKRPVGVEEDVMDTEEEDAMDTEEEEGVDDGEQEEEGGGGNVEDLPDYTDESQGPDDLENNIDINFDTSPDDPDPEDAAKNRPTLGIELEFMLAVCPNSFKSRKVFRGDPHKSDPRWCSKKLGALNWAKHEEFLFDNIDSMANDHNRVGAACRSKLARILRAKGSTVVKVPDRKVTSVESEATTVLPNNFSETDDTDDELEENYTNQSILINFNPAPAVWDSSQTEDFNIRSGTNHFIHQFLLFHGSNNMKLYRTRKEDVWDQLPKLQFHGLWNPAATGKIRSLFSERLIEEIWRAKCTNENNRNQAVDPMHVAIPGMKPMYKAWTITQDESVDGNGMVPARYQLSAGRANEVPMEEYRYFGAEIVSPVLEAGAESTSETIRAICGALRDELRIHKPMILSTGFHVHLGHESGWNLRQLKRFATLWYLTEDQLLRMHRVDRGTDKKWCARIGEGSELWAALYAQDPETLRVCSRALSQVQEPARSLYRQAMEEHTPLDLLTQEQVALVDQLWKIPTITQLGQSLSGHRSREMDGFPIRTGLRWRVSGHKRTNSADENYPQTVEVRVMQGTLDGDHINSWIEVLNCLVDAARNWSPEAYRDLLAGHLGYSPRPQLLHLLRILKVPRATRIYWSAPGRRSASYQWWEYPDKDKVDWDEPFMVPGHRATHGPEWDDLPGLVS